MDAQTTPFTDNKRTLVCLVQAARAGDRDAFAKLFQRYRRLVFATVYRRLANEAETQELCQEVFIQAMRKIHQLQAPEAFGGWLRSIAARMAINRAVRARRTASIDGEGPPAAYTEAETPLGRVLAQERREQVHVGLGRLSSLDRDTLLAFYFRGRSLIEMSNEFRSPVGTIKRRLHVARKRLARELAHLEPA